MSMRKQLTLAVAMLICLAVTKASDAAGNVQAFVEEGILYLAGDRLPNHFFIRPGRVGGIEVNGYSYGSPGEPPAFGWSPTHINGSWSVVFDEAINEILIVTGDGNDQVYLLSGLVGVAVCEVSTGAGADRVTTGFLNGSLSINAGKDADHVSIVAGLGGDLQIDTGHGDDRVQVFGHRVNGVTDINTGVGNDEVQILGDDFAMYHFVDLWINFGQGDDALVFNGFNSDPPVVVSGDALFVGGQGTDTVSNSDALTVDGTLEVIGFE